jgi:hypothetical protein
MPAILENVKRVVSRVTKRDPANELQDLLPSVRQVLDTWQSIQRDHTRQTDILPYESREKSLRQRFEETLTPEDHEAWIAAETSLEKRRKSVGSEYNSGLRGSLESKFLRACPQAKSIIRKAVELRLRAAQQAVEPGRIRAEAKRIIGLGDVESALLVEERAKSQVEQWQCQLNAVSDSMEPKMPTDVATVAVLTPSDKTVLSVQLIVTIAKLLLEGIGNCGRRYVERSSGIVFDLVDVKPDNGEGATLDCTGKRVRWLDQRTHVLKAVDGSGVHELSRLDFEEKFKPFL